MTVKEKESTLLERLHRQCSETVEIPWGEINWVRCWKSGEGWYSSQVCALFGREGNEPLYPEEVARMVVEEDRHALLDGWLTLLKQDAYTTVYRVHGEKGVKWIQEDGWYGLDEEEGPCSYGVMREVTALCEAARARQEREGESWFQQIQGQDQPLLRMFQKDYITCLVHDLKGPASTALAALQLMEKRMEEEISEDNLPFFHRYCSFIEKSCYRMFLTVNDLWETAAAAQEDLELAFVQWHLEDLIQQAIQASRPYAHNREIVFQVEGEGDDVLCCDRERISTVLLKLLANAIRSTGPDGAIQVILTKGKEELQVDVWDNGRLIPKETLYRLFAYPFLPSAQFVRDGLGIGPGMWLAQLLVNLHDGHIWADNQEGRGNCFSFTLSRQPAAAEGRMLLRDSPDSFQRDYHLRIQMEMSVLPTEERGH